MSAPPCCVHTGGFHLLHTAVPSLREAHNVNDMITVSKRQLKKWVQVGAVAFTNDRRPKITITATNGTWTYQLHHRTHDATHWEKL